MRDSMTWRLLPLIRFSRVGLRLRLARSRHSGWICFGFGRGANYRGLCCISPRAADGTSAIETYLQIQISLQRPVYRGFLWWAGLVFGIPAALLLREQKNSN